MKALPTILGALVLIGPPLRDVPNPSWRERLLAEVPFTLYENAVIVPAVVNGRDTVRLLVDTGWGPLALVAAAAQRLRLSLAPPGSTGLRQAYLQSLAIGKVVVSDPVVEVFPTTALAPLIGPHDGVLSTAFFRDLVLQIDYPAGVVRLFDRLPRALQLPTNTRRASVPMVFSSRAGALPFTDSIFVNGRPVRGLFDTGGAGSFVAMPRLVARAGLQPLPDSGHIGIGLLHGDTVVRQAARFTRLQQVALGPFTEVAPRALMAPPQMAGGDWGHDLVIGYGFLRHYIVTFAYPERLVILERPTPP